LFIFLWACAGGLPALMIATWHSASPVRIGIDVILIAALGVVLGPLALPAALIFDWLDELREQDFIDLGLLLMPAFQTSIIVCVSLLI
jgi:hypothetical protein